MHWAWIKLEFFHNRISSYSQFTHNTDFCWNIHRGQQSSQLELFQKFEQMRFATLRFSMIFFSLDNLTKQTVTLRSGSGHEQTLYLFKLIFFSFFYTPPINIAAKTLACKEKIHINTTCLTRGSKSATERLERCLTTDLSNALLAQTLKIYFLNRLIPECFPLLRLRSSVRRNDWATWAERQCVCIRQRRYINVGRDKSMEMYALKSFIDCNLVKKTTQSNME